MYQNSANLKPGVIKFFSRQGFGFIIPDDRGAEVFFHHTTVDSVLGPQLAKDKTVLFSEALTSDGRRRATYVRALDLVSIAKDLVRCYDNKDYDELITTVEKLRLILK